MPDREKVIKESEEAVDILAKAEEPTFWLDFVRCAFENAIALLKEQEAVKPRECQYPHGTYACGFCDYIPIGNKDGYRANYCPNCGRAVKWDADGT